MLDGNDGFLSTSLRLLLLLCAHSALLSISDSWRWRQRHNGEDKTNSEVEVYFSRLFPNKKKGWESKPIKLHTDILILFLWFLSLHSHLPLNEQPQKSWREAWRIEKNRPHCQPDEITINRHWLWAFFFLEKIYWTLCINTHSIEQSNSTSQNNCGEQSMAWLDEK